MKTIIITGATGGLGSSFFEILHIRYPETVFWLVGRNQEKLLKMKEQNPENIRVFASDFAADNPLNEIEKALEEEEPEISWLINNAGYGYSGAFEHEISPGDMIRVNTEIPISLTRMIIPYMGKDSHILNVSSVAGFFPLPEMAVYSTSKAALRFFGKALHEELFNRGISVTTLCPYWIGDTAFIKRIGKSGKINLAFSITAREVAEKGIEGAINRKVEVYPGFAAKLCRFGSLFLPDRLLWWIRKEWKA